jgi:hypothetical protein
MKQNSLWALSGAVLAVICLGAVADAPEKVDKANATTPQKIVSVPDPSSIKQYIDAHRGL